MINIEISPNLPIKAPRKRSLVGAANHRFVKWLTNTSYQKINLDLDTGLITLITRARELAKNNMVVRSYLELMEKNIIGKAGFTLQSQVKDQNGKLDTKLNDFLEWEFYDWMKATNRIFDYRWWAWWKRAGQVNFAHTLGGWRGLHPNSQECEESVSVFHLS